MAASVHPLRQHSGPTALTVVIPAYNEEEGITAILEQLSAQREPLAAVGVRDLEILVVDDGSRDGTAEIVEAFPGVRLVRHGTNRGYGAALKTGFQAATHEWLAFMDADGTYPPEALPLLCRTAQAGDTDLIIASRMSGERSEMPKVRRLGNLIFARMLSVVANQHVSDSASGMRLFHRDLLALMAPLPDGLHFTPAMSTVAVHENLRIREVPIAYKERAGRSKLGVVRDGWRFFWAITWNAMLYNPMRLFAMLGFGLLLLAAIVALPPLLFYIQHGAFEEWFIYRFFVVLLLGVASVSLLTFGLAINAAIYLFNPRPIRQGIFARPSLGRPPSLLIAVFGLGLMVLGGVLYLPVVLEYLATLAITRHWSYLSIGTTLTLMGFQLVLAAVLIRVLIALRDHDLTASERAALVDERAA
jgi:glycosyltransferase involved in cell wall biosynthesis